MKTLTVYDSQRKVSGEMQPAKSIKELEGKMITVAVYEEFDVYNNQEKVTLKLQNTFLESGQSVAEAMAKKPAERIKKLEKRLEPYHKKEWKEWKERGGVSTASPDVTESSRTVGAPVSEPEVPSEEEDALFG